MEVRTYVLEDELHREAELLAHLRPNEWVCRSREGALARGLLREMLGERMGCAPSEITFEVAPGGKPRLAGGEEIAFSLSHSRGLVAIALGADPGARIGIDVESADRRFDVDAFCEHVLHPAESARIRALPQVERQPALLRLLIAKEAYVKALGCGFRLDPRDFDVDAVAVLREFEHKQGRSLWLGAVCLIE